jgi:hypothetical protein
MYTGHYIRDNGYICGPAGHTQFRVRNGVRVYGLSPTLPWAS